MPATPLPPVTVPPGAMPPPPIAIPPGPHPVLPITSEHKTSNDACIKRLRQLHIDECPRIYPINKPAGTYGKEVSVQSNVFGIEVEGSMELFQYSVSIKADLTALKEVVFTKKGKEDFVVKDRHEKCCSVFYHALAQHSDFFNFDNNVLLYDGQSMLYSKLDLFPNHNPVLAKTRVFPLNGAEVPNADLQKFPCIKMEVFATKNPSVVFSQEYVGKRSTDPNMAAVNTAYRNILELALNQSCVQDFGRCVVFEHGKIFFLKPREEGFLDLDMVNVGDGKQMMPGIKKTVQFVEGPYGRGQCNPSVVIDAMKVAFHKEQPVVEKLKEITSTLDAQKGLADFERERCVAVIKGLDCYSNYTGRVRHLKIEGLHHEGAAKARFQMKDGGSTTVAEYFKARWNIVLKYPDLNLIVCKERGNLNYYPMELMYITANQRVKISQQTSAQSQKTTKESAVQPDIRQRLIMTGKEAAKITSECEMLGKLGIRVCEAPLLVKARQFPPVKLAVNTTGAPISQRDNKWRIGQYARSAVAPKIWALYAVGTPVSRFNEAQLNKFGAEFINVCTSKGINLDTPKDCKCVLASDIEAQFALAQKAGCQFIFCITDDSITNLHQKYKMHENLRTIVIQDMKMSKALSVIEQGKRLTLENVINKTNVKLGGTNYMFLDTKKFLDKVLVIGVGLSHPPPGTKFLCEGKGYLNPTIIGFAHNGKSQQEFTGDFVLSPAGQDTISPIEDIMTESIKGYQKWHHGELPDRIVVYRSGVSEGNHGSVIAYEIPLARAALREFSHKIQMIYITVSKDHTYRFFRNDLESLSQRSSGSSGSQASMSGSRTSLSSAPPLKSSDINIPPGLSIDHNVTNPAIKQFFLNSHITLQGTAKTPLYSVLADDTQAKMESLEEFTYNLCHLHQIVGLPTSLPTPLYVGNEYAKRGRNLWNEANQKDPQLRGEGSERDRLREITDNINYKANVEFIDRRINA